VVLGRARLACIADAPVRAVGWGLPPGTFGHKVLMEMGVGPDLWKSGGADSVVKCKGPACAGLGGFGSTSSLAGWVGEVCQVFGDLIASVYMGFGGFWRSAGLDRFWAMRGDGGLAAAACGGFGGVGFKGDAQA
jgi:hypothetical protein